MTPTDSSLTVRAELAYDEQIPELTHDPITALIGTYSYRIEAWRLVDGKTAVVGQRLVDAQSLAHASEKVVAFKDEKWGEDALIIEDWVQKRFAGERFRISSRDGRSSEVDLQDLRARGIVLSEDMFQEP